MPQTDVSSIMGVFISAWLVLSALAVILIAFLVFNNKDL